MWLWTYYSSRDGAGALRLSKDPNISTLIPLIPGIPTESPKITIVKYFHKSPQKSAQHNSQTTIVDAILKGLATSFEKNACHLPMGTK